MKTELTADTHPLKPLVLRLRQEAGACRFEGPARLFEELAREVDRIEHDGEVVLPHGRTVLEEFSLLRDLVDFCETEVLCPEELEAYRVLLALRHQWHQWQTVETMGKVN